MTNRLFFTQANIAFAEDGTRLSGAKAYFYQNGTNTQTTVYADSGFATQHSQPVVADSDGVFAEVYTQDATAVRVLLTDSDDVAISGYPMDDIVPLAAEQSAAEDIPFSATDDLPYTNVQSAIEGAAALSTDQLSIFKRALTPYSTGGTGDDYTVTPSPAITSYSTGDVFTIRPDRANTTTSVTLDVNSLGTRDIKKINGSGSTVALAVGDLQVGREVMVYYDGTRFLTIFGRNFPRSGSSSNGRWVQYEDGTQVCTKSGLELTFSNSVAVNGTWTFPQAFSSITNLTITAAIVPPTRSTSPGGVTGSCASMTTTHLGHIGVGTITTSSCLVRLSTVGFSGVDTFQSGDLMYVDVTATGSWA